MCPDRLEKQLMTWYTLYHKPEYLRIDPLVSVRKLRGTRNLEIGALVASVLAYGKVEVIIRNCEWLFSVMNWQPFDFISSTDLQEKKSLLQGFKHRFNDSSDLAMLLQSAAAVIKKSGSIEALFCDGIRSGDLTTGYALGKFTDHFKRMACGLSVTVSRSFDYLFPSPESGSACKRLNMYLRWVVRHDDAIDLGIWNNVKPSLLMMPVDTHVAAQARKLGLTRRGSPDWKMVEEITSHLRTIDPLDPVRFDFSMCRAGMIGKSGYQAR